MVQEMRAQEARDARRIAAIKAKAEAIRHRYEAQVNRGETLQEPSGYAAGSLSLLFLPFPHSTVPPPLLCQSSVQAPMLPWCL